MSTKSKKTLAAEAAARAEARARFNIAIDGAMRAKKFLIERNMYEPFGRAAVSSAVAKAVIEAAAAGALE